MRDWDDENVDLHESEDPDYPDAGEDEDDEEVPCPYCQQPVYEDAERCPGCGAYLSREDAPRRHRWWVVIGVLIGLAVVLSWVVRR